MPGVGCVILDRKDGMLESGELSAQGVRDCRGGHRAVSAVVGLNLSAGRRQGTVLLLLHPWPESSSRSGKCVCRADSLWSRHLYICVNIATVPRNATFNVYSPPWCFCASFQVLSTVLQCEG